MKLFISILLFFCFKLSAQTKPDLIVGDWMTSERNAVIRCFKQNDKYYGKVIWYAPFDEKDENRKIHPSENVKYLNKIIMQDFVFGKNEWNNGKINDPHRNKTYQAFVKINQKNQMEVTGFVIFRWMSQTMILNKVERKITVNP